MPTAYLGLGSNLGDIFMNIASALSRLRGLPHSKLWKESQLYRTEPVDMPDTEWFVNMVVSLRTELEAAVLLKQLQRIEDDLGRMRPDKGLPRVIDIDILMYGNRIIDGPDLTVPHPKMHKRRFVLEPMRDIAPEVLHPKLGMNIMQLLDQVEDEGEVLLVYDSIEEAMRNR